MKSLRELSYELMVIRLGTGDNSIWNMGNATYAERARNAINSGLRKFEFYQQSVYEHSGIPTPVIALPGNVRRVNRVEYVAPNGYRTPVPSWSMIPTAQTVLLQIQNPAAGIQVSFEERVQELPPDTFLIGPMYNTYTVLDCSAVANPKANWPCPGYLELTADDTLGPREVIKYAFVAPSGFSGITRGVQGEPMDWTAGARVSCATPIEPEDVNTVMAHAQGEMYSYWMTHRAQYTEYTAVAGPNAVGLDDLGAIIQMYNREAADAYRRTRKAPAPAKAGR
jgi:hypothetical protein